MDLNNNEDLIRFINELLDNDKVNVVAPALIKFFIITRNYGLINLRDNIHAIYNGKDFEMLVSHAIRNGFENDGVQFNAANLIKLLVKNYHENGFYFYSFPGIYLNQIKENGLPIKNDPEIEKIIDKYNLGDLFNRREKVVEYLHNRKTHENALKCSLGEIDIDELKQLMKKNSAYKEADFILLCGYIEKVLRNYIDSKHSLGIALIEKSKVEDYFGKRIDTSIVKQLEDFAMYSHMSDYDMIRFITSNISSNEEEIIRPIPKELLNLYIYGIEESEKQKNSEMGNNHVI